MQLVEDYAFILIGLAALVMGLAFLTWPSRKRAGGYFHLGLLAATAIYMLFSGLEMLASGASTKILCSQLSYVGLVCIAPLLYSFIHRFIQQEKRPRVAPAVLWCVPVIILALVWTNRYHGLIWSGFKAGAAGSNLLTYERGIGWYANALFMYGIILLAGLELYWARLKLAKVYQHQANVLLLAIVFPCLAGLVHVLRLEMVAGLDFAPFGFVFTSVILSWGTYRLGLFQIVPIAREWLLDHMDEGMLVLGPDQRILDANYAAQRVFGAGVLVPGRNLRDLRGKYPELAKLSGGEGPALLEWGTGASARFVEVTRAPLRGGQQDPLGEILMCRDVTERRQMEAAVQRYQAESVRRVERRRLARELHDSVTQSLHSLVMSSETARHLYETEPERLEKTLSHVEASARQALKEMRLLLYELRLVPLEEIRFVDAIRTRLDAVEARANVEAELLVQDGLTWPRAWEMQLYPITMEALNNSLKHARASRVMVRITGDTRCLELEIADNGCGFDLRQCASGGIGLASMSERAQQLGGRLKVESARGAGTRILVQLDLPQDLAA